MRKIFDHITGISLVLALLVFASACKKDTIPAGKITAPPHDTIPAIPPGPVTYSLLWSDEFSGASVADTSWTMETGNLHVNNEKEYYQPSNATVESGNLVITAKKEAIGGLSYTSARMNTFNKFSVTYGRIEARIKLPLGAGLWPAFWMLGSNIQSVSWPDCGEIDIMEHINADNLIYGTMHWNGGNGHAQYGDKLAISNPDDYHVYAVEWDNKSIRWYVDDTLFVSGNIANDINHTAAFHLPFFIVLNLAVGGDFPNRPVDESKLPAKMFVDYVRVYKAN